MKKVKKSVLFEKIPKKTRNTKINQKGLLNML